MKPNRRTLFGAVVVALALFVITGGGMALAQGPGASMLDNSDDDDSIAQDDVSLSEADAVGIATAEADGTVEEVELESEGGTPAYEVELVASNGTETEVTVHANDGTVLETESEDESEDDETEPEDESEDDETEPEDESEDDEEYVAPGNVSLSEQDAVGIATAEIDGTVEEVELESEDGTPAYEVELVTSNGAETEVTVHANDGTVLETESEGE